MAQPKTLAMRVLIKNTLQIPGILNNNNINKYHRKNCIQIMHVVYETLSHLNMKFYLYFARFCMCKFVCVSELFYFIKVISIGTKKLTNTFKLTHRNNKIHRKLHV
jgi:hypothetical protein